jgi:hypothetical protein
MDAIIQRAAEAGETAVESSVTSSAGRVDPSLLDDTGPDAEAHRPPDRRRTR